MTRGNNILSYESVVECILVVLSQRLQLLIVGILQCTCIAQKVEALLYTCGNNGWYSCICIILMNLYIKQCYNAEMLYTKWDTSIVVGFVHYKGRNTYYCYLTYTFHVLQQPIKRHATRFNCFFVTPKLRYKDTRDPISTHTHTDYSVIKLWETGMYVYSCLDKLFQLMHNKINNDRNLIAL